MKGKDFKRSIEATDKTVTQWAEEFGISRTTLQGLFNLDAVPEHYILKAKELGIKLLLPLEQSGGAVAQLTAADLLRMVEEERNEKKEMFEQLREERNEKKELFEQLREMRENLKVYRTIVEKGLKVA